MKPGRVIDGDVHDASVTAARILDTARQQADRMAADATQLAERILADARREAERVSARADAELAEARATVARLTAAAGAPQATDGGVAAGIAVTPPAAKIPLGAGSGMVDEVTGLVVRGTVPGVSLGEVVRIDRRDREPLPAEVVGFRGDQAVMLPLGELGGVSATACVWRTGEPLSIRCADDLLGRVVDGVGAPIDGGPALTGERWAVDRPAPSPTTRPAITTRFSTGVRAIDALLTLGRGQRVGLFSAAGVGKSTLLGQIARGADVDVIVVCQVGERGRELGELLGEELASARAKTVVVSATSDAPPLVRLRAAHTATAIAEWFRERRGASVLLLLDSLTRVARAQREVGLAIGEPPARHGYPASVFGVLPRLVERTGTTRDGAITAIYTVLVAGNDLDEPIADEVRGFLDGHVVLERRLAQRGQFPPIDVLASTSRVMHRVADAGQLEAASWVRARLSVYEEHRDLITLGALQPGRDRAVDDAVAAYPTIEALIRQARDEIADVSASVGRLLTVHRQR